MSCKHTPLRLDRALGDLGIATRSRLKEMVRRGLVSVDGVVVQDPGQKLCPLCSEIRVEGQPVRYRPYLYLMLNKPQGVVSATEDRRERTVLDLLPEGYRHLGLFPVGRLDKDTTGLLLLTNDGPLGHALTSPRRHRDKVYLARVEGALGEADREALRRGILLRDGLLTRPAELEILEPDLGRVVLREGKYHQVRRMLAALGHPVLALRRVEMAGLSLDEKLAEGRWRPLTDPEVSILRGDNPEPAER